MSEPQVRHSALPPRGPLETLLKDPTISDIKLENIDVQLKDENLKAVDVKNLNFRNVKVNGKPFMLKPAG